MLKINNIINNGISGRGLKIIACVSMFCSHIYICLRLPLQWEFLNVIGRIAFPIYCFLLTEGFFHTSNQRRYLTRLLIVALLSEIPFDLAVYGTYFYPMHQNVLFTLAIGLFILVKIHKQPDRLGRAIWLIFGIYAAWLLRTDYAAFGIIVIAGFYYFHSNKFGNMLFFLFTQLVLSSFFYSNIQKAGAFAILVLSLYNGKQGKIKTKMFYFIYPVHFLILVLFRQIFY